MGRFRNTLGEPRQLPWLGATVVEDEIFIVPDDHDEAYEAAGFEPVEQAPRRARKGDL